MPPPVGAELPHSVLCTTDESGEVAPRRIPPPNVPAVLFDTVLFVRVIVPPWKIPPPL